MKAATISAAGISNVSGRLFLRKLRSEALLIFFSLKGIDVDKNAIQRMESGQRFVTDIELRALASIFQVKVDELLEAE